MSGGLTAELMRKATFAAIGEVVHDRIPASDVFQSAACTAETDCWREADGMWVCSPCLSRFREVPPAYDVGYPRAQERLAEHIRQHLTRRYPMLIAFYCFDHLQMERPALAS